MRAKSPRPYNRSRTIPRRCPVTYYATTAIQSNTTVSTIVCAVTVPSDLSAFRQQCYSLKMAKQLHPDENILMVVERSKLPVRAQSAVSQQRPSYTWTEDWDAEII